MKTIIAGSRDILDASLVSVAIGCASFGVSEVVCGMASGVDTLGWLWAKEHDIPVKEFPANWSKYGKRAGYLRNQEMANYADALIAVWDGRSVGTRHMIDIAKEKGLKTFIYRVLR